MVCEKYERWKAGAPGGAPAGWRLFRSLIQTLTIPEAGSSAGDRTVA